MAAIAYPVQSPVEHGRRPERHLRVVPQPGSLRRHRCVYRRRRLVVALAAVLALVAGALALQALVGMAGDALAPTSGAAAGGRPAGGGQTYVVQPGDTLWRIAERTTTGGDLRVAVDRLAAANGGAAVRAGDRIVLPGG